MKKPESFASDQERAVEIAKKTLEEDTAYDKRDRALYHALNFEVRSCDIVTRMPELERAIKNAKRIEKYLKEGN